MKRLIVALMPLVLGVPIAATAIVCGTGCATVPNDPVGTNAARYEQSTNLYRATLRGWTAVLQADLARTKPVISPTKREEFERARQQVYILLNGWKASVDAGLPYNNVDAFFAALDTIARILAEEQTQ